MEIKLKKGQKFKVKNVTLDERDELLDSIQYELNNDGSVKGVKMMHSTMTKWLRTCLEDGTDDFILGLSLDDKSEIFTKLQTIFFQGEGKASK
jgi:hypothetical protein|tara:strand:- start:3438 stop:3716 length:279 start_codon:yes stop_codon:yes gene_type:complete